MRIAHYTTIITSLLIFGACAGIELPPAIPEERQPLATMPPDLVMDPDSSVPLTEVTMIGEPLMRELQSPTLDYKTLRKQDRKRQRDARSKRPEAPPMRGESLTPVAMAQEPLTRVAFTPSVPMREPERAEVSRPLDRPRKAESPEQVIGEVNTATLVTPQRRWMTGGIVRYPYEVGRTYLVLTAVDNPTMIFLPPGQRLRARLALDPKKFDCAYPEPEEDGGRRESVILLAQAPGLTSTTPLLMHNGLTLWLKVQSVEEKGMRGVTWRIPDETLELHESAAGKQPEVVELPGMPALNPERLHRGYQIEVSSGSPPWVPVTVFDDGRRTVIKFASSLAFGNAPGLFSLHANGEAGVVEWTVYEVPGKPDEPSYYLVQGLWPRLILKGTDGMAVTITRGLTRQAVYQAVGGGR